MIKKMIKWLLITVFWIALWWIAATYIVRQEILLPSPMQVLQRLRELMQEKDFYIATLTSLLRIFIGILIAMILGIV